MKVGSLVECMKEFVSHKLEGESYPIKGELYTIREIFLHGIRLEEIINPKHRYMEGYHECAFNSKHFRELLPPIDISELLTEHQFLTTTI